MNNVACMGSEINVLNCPHNTHTGNCYHYQDAGGRCPITVRQVEKLRVKHTGGDYYMWSHKISSLINCECKRLVIYCHGEHPGSKSAAIVDAACELRQMYNGYTNYNVLLSFILCSNVYSIMSVPSDHSKFVFIGQWLLGDLWIQYGPMSCSTSCG